MTVLERVGSTPLLQLEGLFIKLECSNPGGSVKDRIARFMLEEAARRGELLPDDHIVEATSGNTGIALAFVGRQLGYRVLIFMPEHMSPERRRMMENLGAEVRLTPRAESFRGAIARRDAFRGRTGYYIPDQFANPDNVRCHALTTGHELVQQLRDRGHHGLDWFVAGVGTGGTLMGVARALRAHMPGVAIAAVEPEESAVLSGGQPGDHGIMGIGDGFVPDLVDPSAIDLVIRVHTEEARAEAARLRARHGYCVGVSSGANMVAAARLLRRAGRVATLWPDGSDRYGSSGLEPPLGDGSGCALGPLCAARSRGMLRRKRSR
jgi:cysteine synthase A